jgi:asparagine synthase (glutamine-hydrolysing)
MCRIAGIISPGLSGSEINEKLKLMCASLQHGGPDDAGIFYDKHTGVAFGHRRLSIIDLSKNGHQPMASPDQKTWITFNGEIYNYIALKKHLSNLGYKFLSGTDTEVILVAYQHWGTEAFSRLRGMFAFAIYDADKSITYLVRDSVGVKPLYYHINSGSLSFASEVRAFTAGKITQEADPEWQVRFLAFGHVPEPYTTLKNVLSLPKKHFLSWKHETGEHRLTPYEIHPQNGNYITDYGIAKTYLAEGLRQAVSSQLIADAPIGVFLSGGIDSSLLSLLAHENKEQPLKTVSIFFNEKSYDERRFQHAVSEKFTGEKFAHLVQKQDFELFFPQLFAAMDMPTTDGINTWFISKYAHEDGLKAVISGIGADELFGGYPSFNRIRYLKYLRMMPASLFKMAASFQTDRFRKISFLGHRHPVADYLFLRGLFIPDDIARILDMDTKEVTDILFADPGPAELNAYDKTHAAWFESNFYMQNQLLRDTDVMSMNHGLEVRVPFLSEDFQALVENIAPELRFGNQPKKILIDSFKSILPDIIWNRPKMGFTFPLQEWMSQHAEISESGRYKGKFAQKAIDKFANGGIHWSKIFALFQIQQHG